MDRTNERLSNFIAQEIQRRGISARQFAEFVGVSSNTINRMLDPEDESSPSLDFLVKLANATNADLIAVISLAYPEVRQKTALTPTAAIIAQRIEQLAEDDRETVEAFVAGLALRKKGR